MLKNSFLIVLGVLSLFLVAMVISFPLSKTPTSAARGRAADAARWTAMGEYYHKRAEPENLARSRAADAARWEAMGRYYQQFGGGTGLNLLGSRAANIARLEQLAHIKDDVWPASIDPAGMSRLEELELIKGTLGPQ